MYTTDFAYDRPIFLVPLSPSYPSSPVIVFLKNDEQADRNVLTTLISTQDEAIMYSLKTITEYLVLLDKTLVIALWLKQKL